MSADKLNDWMDLLDDVVKYASIEESIERLWDVMPLLF